MKANGAMEVHNQLLLSSSRDTCMKLPLSTDHTSRQVVLETEYDNAGALAFYAAMGFMREKRLFRFYMNGKDAFRWIVAHGTLASRND